MVQLQFDFNLVETKQPEQATEQAKKLKYIDRLRKSAESCLKQSENINTEVSGNWTYRRQNFADSAQRKKERLIKNATILNRIADMWSLNNCPAILQGIRTAGDLEAYYPAAVENNDGWYAQEYPKILSKALRVGLKSQDDNKIFKNAISELSEIKYTPEQIRDLQLKEELKKVHSMNIPGFFPTPDEVIDKMIDYACLDDEHFILEPSAGIGNILDRIKERGFKCTMEVVEQQWTLYQILKLKGYKGVCNSIFENNILERRYNRILMNPPFEKGQDIDHVLHCFNTYLAEGGRLISVMSASVLINNTKKFKDFRDFVEEQNGQYIELGQAFKESFNSTKVSTVLLILNK